ncbi:hypothetical protein AB1Y20_020148 [Prymnesium parvum]|uniref:Uncharacterized protein n=1 Tax=Prymnesium parvum TaxID=97485 RepID=A0AB34JTV1_PRYPA
MKFLLFLAGIYAVAAQRPGAFPDTASFTPPELAARNFTVNAKPAGRVPMAYGSVTSKVINMDALLMVLLLGGPNEWVYTTGTDSRRCAPETYWLAPYNVTKAVGLFGFVSPLLIVSCLIVENDVDIVGKFGPIGFNGVVIIVDKGACYCCSSFITRARGDWSKGLQHDSVPWYITSVEMNGPGFVQWLAIDAISNSYICPASGVFPPPFGGGNCTYDPAKFGLFTIAPGDQHQTFNFIAYECNYVMIGNHAARSSSIRFPW